MHNVRDAPASTIEEQHAAILDCCDDLLSALRGGSSIERIGQVRIKLARLLHTNLALEEQQLIGPIRRLPIANRPRQFTEMSEEAADLRAGYSAHVGEWLLAAIENDKAGYAKAAQSLVRQVRAHLDKKRRLLPLWREAIVSIQTPEA